MANHESSASVQIIIDGFVTMPFVMLVFRSIRNTTGKKMTQLRARVWQACCLQLHIAIEFGDAFDGTARPWR